MAHIELSYVTIYYRDPVVVFIYKKRTLLGVPELKELVSAAEELSHGKPYVTYSDLRSNLDMTEQAKTFLANPKNMPLFRGSAILVSTTLFSFAVNFATLFSKKTYPVKAFVTEEKAMGWLYSLSLDVKKMEEEPSE